MEGWHRITLPYGGTYEGEWHNDLFHGHGKQNWSDGSAYEGEYKEGMKCGHGKHTWPEGRIYVGEFKEDEANGVGKDIWTNGEVYEGEWKDSKYHGHGKYTWPNGTFYEGEYKRDKKSGQGTFSWADGRIYQGEYKDGEMSGRGKHTWPNGEVYEGEWERDKQHGVGVYYDPALGATFNVVYREGIEVERNEVERLPAEGLKWRYGRALIIIVRENRDGAEKDLCHCEEAAKAMNCEYKVLSDINKDSLSPKDVLNFVITNAEWLSAKNFVAFFVASHGGYNTILLPGTSNTDTNGSSAGGGCNGVSSSTSTSSSSSSIGVDYLVSTLSIMMKGKAVLCFVNKCRGSNETKLLKDDDDEESSSSPSSLDPDAPPQKTKVEGQNVYIAYSTSEGKISYRDVSKGSLWLKVLSEVLRRHGKQCNLSSICARVRTEMCSLLNVGALQGPQDMCTLRYPESDFVFDV